MFILVLISLLYPVNEAAAAISMSEVAWMGSVDSANYEWIELVNESTSAVSVAGWSVSDGMNLLIPLSGTIPGESYVLLERNRADGAYLGNPLFVSYSGALVNTGATLTLRDSSGAIVDQVVGGEDWEQIGGDNTTKETAQYTTAGWATAAATPGQPNALTGRAPGPTPSSPSTTSGGGSSNTSTAKKATTPTKAVTQVNQAEALVLTPDVPEVAYVGQPVTMSVTPSGLSTDTIMNSLQYRWNFGDSYVRDGKTVEHIYRYPGEYVVLVEGAFASRRQQARTTITVLPVQLSVTRSEVGDIQLHNNAPYEIALDGYQISGVKTVTLPPETILLPRGTITIARQRLAANLNTPVIVYDARGRVITSTLSSTPLSAPTTVAVVTTPAAPSAQTSAIDWLPLAAASELATPEPTEGARTELVPTVVVPEPASPRPQLPARTFVGVVAIMVVAITALYLTKPRQTRLG